jgi:cell division protein FtsQ
LRSKRKNKSKNKKTKPSYRRGEKIALILKRGAIILLVVSIAAGAVLGIKMLKLQFNVKEIVVSGNYHLDRDDILSAMNIHKGESLMDVPFEELGDNLKKNPWIRNVALRKEYPSTLIVKIDEATPKALLRMRKQLFLVDERGKILESIRGETTPFLPVIKDISPKDSKAMGEALKLVEALSRKSSFSEWESVEIGLESYGLAAHIDGELIKVGYGRYSEKFDRWIELEPEIRKKRVTIKYVDLRFKDSVIVKPMRADRGEASS